MPLASGVVQAVAASADYVVAGPVGSDLDPVVSVDLDLVSEVVVAEPRSPRFALVGLPVAACTAVHFCRPVVADGGSLGYH